MYPSTFGRLLACVALLLTLSARAQTWELLDRTTWEPSSAGQYVAGRAYFNTLTVAANGDIVVGGNVGAKPLLRPIGPIADSASWPQGFMARYDIRTRQWSQLVDANCRGGSWVVQVQALADGDVLLLGNFDRDVPGPLHESSKELRIRNKRLPTPNGFFDGFVARLEGTTGNCRWLAALSSITNTSRVQPQRLALASATEAVVTGTFAGQLQLGNLPPLATALLPTGNGATDFDLFVGRLDLSTGQWTQAARAGGPGNDQASDVAVLPGGDVALTGTVQPPVTLGGTPWPGSPAARQAFVARLDPTATQWRWVQALRSDSASQGRHLAVLPTGDLVVSGTYVGPAQAGSLLLPHGLARASTFVGRLSAVGQWRWVSSGGGTPNEHYSALTVTPAGDVIVGESITGKGRFGRLPLVDIPQEARQTRTDLYVAQLDGLTGQWQWLTLGGNSYRNYASRLSDNSVGGMQALNGATLLVAGGFGPDAKLGADVGPLPASTSDGFLARLIVPGPCPDSLRPAPASVRLVLDSLVCEGARLLRVEGAPAGSGFQWNTGDTGPTLLVRTAGHYTVRVQTGADCRYFLSVDATIPRLPVPPNVLTANSDNLNDRWRIPGLPTGTSVRIYNRWGRLVYQAAEYAHDWTAEGLPAGVYYYVLANDRFCAADQLRGWVEVIR